MGILIEILLAKPLLEHSITADIGLGVIAVAPAILVIYFILFALGGGVAGVVVYNLIRSYRRHA